MACINLKPNSERLIELKVLLQNDGHVLRYFIVVWDIGA